MKKNDLLPTKKYANVMQGYGIGTQKYSNGQPINSRAQAKEFAAYSSNQSYNQGKDYNQAVRARKEASRYGNTKKMEVSEGLRSSSAW